MWILLSAKALCMIHLSSDLVSARHDFLEFPWTTHITNIYKQIPKEEAKTKPQTWPMSMLMHAHVSWYELPRLSQSINGGGSWEGKHFGKIKRSGRRIRMKGGGGSLGWLVGWLVRHEAVADKAIMWASPMNERQRMCVFCVWWCPSKKTSYSLSTFFLLGRREGQKSMYVKSCLFSFILWEDMSTFYCMVFFCRYK